METSSERERLKQDREGFRPWKKWGPYLAERQWGTVREDYSADGSVWNGFTHDQARSRAYRWGEDGLLGFTDRECRLCFAPALWNGNDPILKERLFGLTGHQGNHAEDVKECYYYLDGVPSHAYQKALYKYPQPAYPYRELVEENGRRTKQDPEYELLDTGVFDRDRYFDVFVEYAKRGPDDVLIRITAANRGPESHSLHLLPTLWFRNTWSWGRGGDDYPARPILAREQDGVVTDHPTMEPMFWSVDPEGLPSDAEWLFTHNDTNHRRLFGVDNSQPYVKDAFHRYVIRGQEEAVHPDQLGTKAALWCRFDVPAESSLVLRMRLCRRDQREGSVWGEEFGRVFEQRTRETDRFYRHRIPDDVGPERERVSRQAYAGLLWTKQFYFLDLPEWLEGDPAQPDPPEGRKNGRNHDWTHLYNKNVISMPDTWEFPWYAAWDLAFHTVSLARIDPEFAKQQLRLFLTERYMHPNGALPAYEFAFSDVNPPVHAWAVWRVYKMTGSPGQRDRTFLARCFQKLVLNFTWWVNRKDDNGDHIFSGGFLGLDNIGLFDRSDELPTGGRLEQADGTAWMGFYCGTMLSIALELAREDPAYEDMASKFFEHFIAIADAINSLDGIGLWDEEDGFYYDHLHLDGEYVPLRVRSLVGLVPLLTVEVLDTEIIDSLPGFRERLQWFQRNREREIRLITCRNCVTQEERQQYESGLIALPSPDRLRRMFRYVLDENEFLSPYGIRSLSKRHGEDPYECLLDGQNYRISYEPGESSSGMFGGNSNWRGPVWFPINYLIVEALERYHYFYGDELQVECPTGSGQTRNLKQVARLLSDRLAGLFLPGEDGRRPCHGDRDRYASDPHWKDLILFHEYFHAETGRGCGASHQTGWTALAAQFLEKAGDHSVPPLDLGE